VPKSRLALLLVGLPGFVLGGCMQATLAPSSDASLTPRDRQLLANAPYAQASIPETFRRHIVDYPGSEAPGTILVDTDARYLYYFLPKGQAIRYGVAVGEEALAFSGVAAVGKMAEWPDWIPTPERGSAPTRHAFPEVRPIRWGRGRSIFTRATRTPCTASMVPTSRNISARPYHPAASA
jgi:hypothetical protein